jgi:hypothetical protein
MNEPRPPRRNPFPVDRFIGRAAEVADVISLVTSSHGQSCAIIGEPRMGKTSLLRHLASGIGLAAEPGLIVGHIDAQKFDTIFDRTRFWTAVLDSLEESALFEPADAPLGAAYRRCYGEAFATEAVERFLKAVGKGGRRLVVIIDEFDHLVRRNIKEHDGFFTGLRSLMNGTHRALSVIVASREPLAALQALWHEKRAGGSPPFNVFHEILLGAFTDEDVDAVLDAAGADFSPEDRRFIHGVSGGYAALVQQAALALFTARPTDPVRRRHEAGVTLLPVTSQILADIWRAWPSTTRHVFAAVAVEHLEAMSTRIGWAPAAGLVADPATYPEEYYALERHGFIARSAHTPSGRAVRPLLFLAWCAAKLRVNAQSARAWSDWMTAEGWSDARQLHLWSSVIRPRAAGAAPAP